MYTGLDAYLAVFTTVVAIQLVTKIRVSQAAQVLYIEVCRVEHISVVQQEHVQVAIAVVVEKSKLV